MFGYILYDDNVSTNTTGRPLPSGSSHPGRRVLANATYASAGWTMIYFCCFSTDRRRGVLATTGVWLYQGQPSGISSEVYGPKPGANGS